MSGLLTPSLYLPRWATIALMVAVCTSCSSSSPVVITPASISAPIPPQQNTKSSPLIPAEPVKVAALHSVIEAQRALNDLGYSVGRPDGIMGPATRKAVLAFQRDNRLLPDGLLSETLIERLIALQSDLPKSTQLTIARGDIIIYSDGTLETGKSDGPLSSLQRQGNATVVALRPSTDGWPTEAKIGLDWATSHALDEGPSEPPVIWSSTGVAERFEIRAYSFLSLRDAKLGDEDALVCRRFEMREDQSHRSYPAIACKNEQGLWQIPHSKIVLAAPATDLKVKKDVATK